MDEPPSFSLASNAFLVEGLVYPFFLVTIILIFIAAFLCACESAVFSLTSADLEWYQKRNSQKDRIIGSVLHDPHLLQVSFLIVQAIIRIGIVTGSTFLLWNRNYSMLETGFGLTLISTLFLVFVELLPKIYGRNHAIKFAPIIAGVCGLLVTIFQPIALPLLNIMKRWEKKFVSKRTSADELSEVLEMAANIDVTTEGEKEILQGIVNFGTLTVRQVMRSRSEISASSDELSFVELMQFVNKSGFSRIPVYKKGLDNIEGVLYIKDLLPFLEYPADFEWKKLLRPAFYVHETKKIDLLLKDFQEKRVHMALITDENKIVIGLVTLEDLIEEIIGEINDEFDEVDFFYKKVDEKTYIFDGRTSLYDFCKALEIDYDTLRGSYGQVESIGDLISELSEGPVTTGVEINYEPFTFIIEAAGRKRIKRVRVKVHAQA